MAQHAYDNIAMSPDRTAEDHGEPETEGQLDDYGYSVLAPQTINAPPRVPVYDNAQEGSNGSAVPDTPMGEMETFRL